MGRSAFLGALWILSGSMLSTLCPASAWGGGSLLQAEANDGASRQATQRHVQGIITAVEGASVTITPPQGKSTVTGRVEDRKTKIMLDGRPARVEDLRVTYSAKGDLGLDDTWVSIVAVSVK